MFLNETFTFVYKHILFCMYCVYVDTYKNIFVCVSFRAPFLYSLYPNNNVDSIVAFLLLLFSCICVYVCVSHTYVTKKRRKRKCLVCNNNVLEPIYLLLLVIFKEGKNVIFVSSICGVS